MTIPEACQLVIQAGGDRQAGRGAHPRHGRAGAHPRRRRAHDRRCRASDIEIVFTGLRDGEKLHEELVGRSRALERPFHPKIAHTHADPIHPERLDRAGWEARIIASPRGGSDCRDHRRALGGGDAAVSERIYLSSPDVGQLEEDAVVAAMRSGWIAPLGPDVDAFERETRRARRRRARRRAEFRHGGAAPRAARAGRRAGTMSS